MKNRRGLVIAMLILQLACARPHPVAIPSADEVRDIGGGPASTAPVRFWLTILHSSHMESHIVNPGGQQTAFGGMDRFRSVLSRLEAETAPATNHAHRSAAECGPCLYISVLTATGSHDQSKTAAPRYRLDLG